MIGRRRFLKSTAAGISTVAFAGGFRGVHSSTACAAQTNSALSKLSIACVGTANRAAANISAILDESLVALCDIDSRFLEKKNSEIPGAKTYVDYREMIDAEKDRIDAVLIATTDHHHAIAAMQAMQAGKHVYCEKPLSHTVEEARVLTEYAAEKGLVTQLGTQIHAGNNYRRVVELVRSKAIGDIKHIHVWIGGKGWGGGELPEKADPVPEHLDWDLWLGPAAERPYAAKRYHPAQWRKWWAFGGGTLGDMGCHYVDLPFWALDLKYPTRVAATGPKPHPETAPLGLRVDYDFPAGEFTGKPFKMTWYHDQMAPKELEGIKLPGSGVLFVGENGMLYSNYGSHKLYPEDKFSNFEAPAESIPNSIGHHKEWVEACKNGGKTTCDFAYSGPLTEAVLLGNVAYRSEMAFDWDGENCKSGISAVDKLLTKEYRAGWELTPAVKVG